MFHSCCSALDQRKASARCRAEGQGACFPQAAGGQQAARPGTEEKRVPVRRGEPGCTAGVEERLSRREPSILPASSKTLGLRDFYVAPLPTARGCRQGAEARRWRAETLLRS